MSLQESTEWLLITENIPDWLEYEQNLGEITGKLKEQVRGFIVELQRWGLFSGPRLGTRSF